MIILQPDNMYLKLVILSDILQQWRNYGVEC